MKTTHTLKDLYSFPGFRARATLRKHPSDAGGRVVTLERRQKKVPAVVAGTVKQASTTGGNIVFVIKPVAIGGFILNLNTAVFSAHSVKP
jgi:hypothetical protein